MRLDLSQSALAARAFAQHRDLPDVVGFADLAYDPGSTYAVARSRLASGSAFGDSETFPLPKGSGLQTRPMTVLNPYDDVTMRAYVGRCSEAIRRATDKTGVLNGLIDRTGSGWNTLNFSTQYQRRMALRREYYDRPETGAIGMFDAKEFFSNCGHETVGALLEAAGAPTGAARVLTKMLGQVFPSGAGLPMGFEGSGPIANLFFAEVDRELRRRNIPFVRWTDDLDTFLRSIDDWDEILGMVQTRLLAVGIALNLDKSAGFEKGPGAEHRLFDSSRDSIFCEEDPAAAAEDRFEGELMMEEFGFIETPPAGAFRNRLRGLRRTPSAAAMEFLKAHPEWLDREPRAVGDYLKVLSANSHTHCAIDLDWLMDRAVGREPSRLTAAGQMHALRALAAYKVDKPQAKELRSFAERQASSGDFLALGAWAIRAWSESRGWKRQPATALIRDIDHVGYRRAAVLGFTRMEPAHQERHLGPIRRDHPETGPTVSLVLSGATPGSHLP